MGSSIQRADEGYSEDGLLYTAGGRGLLGGWAALYSGWTRATRRMGCSIQRVDEGYWKRSCTPVRDQRMPEGYFEQMSCSASRFWANDSVGKNKGGDTTTRTEIETAGSGKDLGFWIWPLEAGRCKQHLTLAKGRTRHPQPLHSSATVEDPRARTESRH